MFLHDHPHPVRGVMLVNGEIQVFGSGGSRTFPEDACCNQLVDAALAVGVQHFGRAHGVHVCVRVVVHIYMYSRARRYI